MDYTKITTFESVATMSLVALTPILLTYPQNESIEFGSASVLQFLYSSIIASIFLLIFLYMYKPFKNKNVLDVSEFLGGKFLKITTGILIALYSLVVCTFTLYEFGEDLQNVMFLNSSMAQVNILLVIAMGFGTYYGLKGIFRSSTVIFPIIVLGIILLFLALYNKIDLSNLTPVFGTGYEQVFIAGGLRLGAFNSLFILFIIGNYVENMKKCLFSSLGSIVAIATILIFLLFTIFSHSALTQNSFAIFELTRMVSFGRFFQRIESIFALLWIMVACIFLSISLYIPLDIFRQIFNIRYYKRIIPCVSLLIFVGSLLIPDYTFSITVRKILYTYVSPILFFAYPLIILIFAKVKSSGGNNEIKE